jgi:NitT/TauT family transport system ATP-binding protein
MTEMSIKIENLKKVFPGNPQEFVVFDRLNVSFKKSAITGVIGPSGCGKTILLRMISGLEKQTLGEIKYSNRNSSNIGMVFQEYTAFPWKTVGGNISFALSLAGVPASEQTESVDYWLNKTGLIKFKDYYPSQLSGGMKQRLAFARCCSIKPQIILMDEPFGSLDSITRLEMISFAEKILYEEGLTGILVTHNINEAILLCDRVMIFSKPPTSILAEFDINISRLRTNNDNFLNEIHNIESRIKKELKGI